MLSVVFTISAMFAIILFTHNYILDSIHKDALSKPEPDHPVANKLNS
jgi:hypothetical protein